MNVKEIVYKKLGKLTKSKFNDDSNIYEIGIDSLDLVDMITEAEDEFKITITDDDLEKFKTVGDVIEGIKKRIK